MTPEQCIQRLAPRLGLHLFIEQRGKDRLQVIHDTATPWTLYQNAESHKARYTKLDWSEWKNSHCINGERITKLLKSIDALRPVLATMTEEEWDRLDDILTEKYVASSTALNCRFLLTLDPQQLAFAIAEAIGEEKV